jgi:hypothetical protein
MGKVIYLRRYLSVKKVLCDSSIKYILVTS